LGGEKSKGVWNRAILETPGMTQGSPTRAINGAPLPRVSKEGGTYRRNRYKILIRGSADPYYSHERKEVSARQTPLW